jgi:hypothetical protein
VRQKDITNQKILEGNASHCPPRKTPNECKNNLGWMAGVIALSVVIGHSVCLIFLDESISSLSKFVPKFTKLGHVEGRQLCGQTSSCQVDNGTVEH